MHIFTKCELLKICWSWAYVRKQLYRAVVGCFCVWQYGPHACLSRNEFSVLGLTFGWPPFFSFLHRPSPHPPPPKTGRFHVILCILCSPAFAGSCLGGSLKIKFPVSLRLFKQFFVHQIYAPPSPLLLQSSAMWKLCTAVLEANLPVPLEQIYTWVILEGAPEQGQLRNAAWWGVFAFVSNTGG